MNATSPSLAVDEAVPRPEYPRPNFRRNVWVNLNGTWEFSFDDSLRGLRLGWQDGRKFDGRILVPFAYQTQLSGIDNKGFHPVVWYARSFDYPAEWKGRDLLLHFGAVDYACTVYVNGEEVGHNKGGHVPFAFDISPYCKVGENRLTLRVVDELDPFQPRGKQSITGVPHGIDYYCTTGIWQTVWLEPVSSMRIQRLKVTPIISERAFELVVLLHAPSNDWTVEADVFDGDERVVTQDKEISGAVARLFLRIPDAKLWCPDDPHLYDLTVRLKWPSGEVADEVFSYAGLRDVSVRHGSMWLNGKPIYLKMVLDQGYWPGGHLTAPSDEALKADVELAKSFGFNGVRKHQKVEDPRWLYWCDRLGMLVWGEMANSRAWSSDTEEMLEAEWLRAVERDANHPCIVAWVPVNESMGFPDMDTGHPGQYAFVERIVLATRKVDPYRPVIDNDGWEHTDVTDIVAIHDYSPTGRDLLARYQEKLKGGPLPPATWISSKPIFAQNSRYWGQPIMLTEVGGFLFVPPEVPPAELDDLYNSYGSVRTYKELLDRISDLFTAIASLPFVTGFCYTQLTDVEQEMNGLVAYDRSLKFPPSEVRERLKLIVHPKANISSPP